MSRPSKSDAERALTDLQNLYNQVDGPAKQKTYSDLVNFVTRCRSALPTSEAIERDSKRKQKAVSGK